MNVRETYLQKFGMIIVAAATLGITAMFVAPVFTDGTAAIFTGPGLLFMAWAGRYLYLKETKRVSAEEALGVNEVLASESFLTAAKMASHGMGYRVDGPDSLGIISVKGNDSPDVIAEHIMANQASDRNTAEYHVKNPGLAVIMMEAIGGSGVDASADPAPGGYVIKVDMLKSREIIERLMGKFMKEDD